MTATELQKLRTHLQAMINAGATTAQIDDWADTYAFTRADLIDLFRLIFAPPQEGDA